MSTTPRPTAIALLATLALTAGALATFLARAPVSPAAYLMLFPGLFAVRVAGQLWVAAFAPAWLPPMADWNFVPYRVLLPVQLLLLVALAWVIAGLVALRGYDGMIYATGWLVGWPALMFLLAEPVRNLGKYTFADVVALSLTRPKRLSARDAAAAKARRSSWSQGRNRPCAINASASATSSTSTSSAIRPAAPPQSEQDRADHQREQQRQDQGVDEPGRQIHAVAEQHQAAQRGQHGPDASPESAGGGADGQRMVGDGGHARSFTGRPDDRRFVAGPSGGAFHR